MNLTTPSLPFRYSHRLIMPGLALLLAACTATSVPAGTIPAPTAAPAGQVGVPVTTTAPLTTSATVSTTDVVTPTTGAEAATPALTDHEQALVEAAIALVAAETGVDPATLTASRGMA